MESGLESCFELLDDLPCRVDADAPMAADSEQVAVARHESPAPQATTAAMT